MAAKKTKKSVKKVARKKATVKKSAARKTAAKKKSPVKKVSSGEISTKKVRNKSLSIWLWLILVLNVLIGIGYMTYDFSGDFPNAEPFIFKVFGLISFLNAYLVYLLFKWKKVGFYVFTGIALFAFAINFSITNSLVDAAYGLLAPLILYLFMRPQWDLFE